MQESLAVALLTFFVVIGAALWQQKRSRPFLSQLLKALAIALMAGMLTFLWTFSAQGLYRMVLVIAAVMALIFLLMTGVNRWHRKRYPLSPAGPRFKALPIALISGGVIVVWAFMGLIVLFSDR